MGPKIGKPLFFYLDIHVVMHRSFSELLSISIICIFFLSCNGTSEVNHAQPESILIGFGSCAHQDKPLPMLSIASDLDLDAFLFLGDNIYGDTRNMDTLRAKYSRLGTKSEFIKLKDSTALYAVWDDHDYGENDAGRHYPHKEESKGIFLDFWEVPASSERRAHDGIYGTEYLKKGDLDIQLILLDTRTFRDNLLYREPGDTLGDNKNDYCPLEVPDSTLLGVEQWKWLEETLRQPADIRIIASSIQFSHEYNGWESWTNMPYERQRMVDLIRNTQAEGVLFVSGDVHWGEISKLSMENGYPLYDVTSSGISQTWDIVEPNKNRIGDSIPQNNIGLITIRKWEGSTIIDLALIDSTGQSVESYQVNANDLKF